MNCADIENLLADYIDRKLEEPECAQLEEHLARCAQCQEFTRDVTAGAAFLRRAEKIVPPPELITRIAYHAPAGRTRGPFDAQGFLSKIAGKWIEPFLQPKFAMGMAMTILSFAMLERCTGVKIQHIQAADLNPVRVWDGVEDRVIRVKDRAEKYYDNVRLVYKIETRLKALQEEPQAFEKRQAAKKTPASRSSGSTRPRNATDQGEKK